MDETFLVLSILAVWFEIYETFNRHSFFYKWFLPMKFTYTIFYIRIYFGKLFYILQIRGPWMKGKKGLIYFLWLYIKWQEKWKDVDKSVLLESIFHLLTKSLKILKKLIFFWTPPNLFLVKIGTGKWEYLFHPNKGLALVLCQQEIRTTARI